MIRWRANTLPLTGRCATVTTTGIPVTRARALVVRDVMLVTQLPLIVAVVVVVVVVALGVPAVGGEIATPVTVVVKTTIIAIVAAVMVRPVPMYRTASTAANHTVSGPGPSTRVCVIVPCTAARSIVVTGR